MRWELEIVQNLRSLGFGVFFWFFFDFFFFFGGGGGGGVSGIMCKEGLHTKLDMNINNYHS